MHMIQTKIIWVAMMIAIIAGCSTPAEIPVDPVTKPAPTETGITRVISTDSASPGEDITVDLYINLEDGFQYYIFEEVIPEGFVAVDVTPDANNHLKIVKIQDAQSTVFSYTVKAPAAGTYAFSGQYAHDGIESPVEIMGDTQITVG